MKYYKVNAKGSQVRKNVKKIDILIESELYTEKELVKFANVESVFVKRYFEIVEIGKNKTYFFFGARFAIK